MKKTLLILLLSIATLLCSCSTSTSSEHYTNNSNGRYEWGYEDGYEEGYSAGYSDGIPANDDVESKEDLEAGPYCESCGRPQTYSDGSTDEDGADGYVDGTYYWVCYNCAEKLAESRTPLTVRNESIYIQRGLTWFDPIGIYLSRPFWFDPISEIDEYTETDTLAVAFKHAENEDSIAYLRSDWLGENTELAASLGFTYENRDECDLDALIEKDEAKLLQLPDNYKLVYYEDIPYAISYSYDENGENIICVEILTVINGVKICYLYFTVFVESYWQKETIIDLMSIFLEYFPSGEEATAFFERAKGDE